MKRASSSSRRAAESHARPGGFGVGLVLGTIVVGGFVGVIIYRVMHPPPVEPPHHQAVVVDTSVSVTKDCVGLESMLREKIDGGRVPKRSRFALIEIGSDDNRWEPKLVLNREIPWMAAGTAMLSGAAGAGQDRDGFYREVRTACEGLKPARGSSIYRAVSVALDHVRGLCAGVEGCAADVIVASDLEENVHSGVEEEVFGKAQVKARLNNDSEQLNVQLCGYTMTAGQGAPRTDGEALIKGWRKLFTRPEGVSFQPYCSAPTRASR